jgi:hypothetical protein
VDSEDEATAIPRYYLPNFPGTLTDSPGIYLMLKIWRRLTRRPFVASVVMTAGPDPFFLELNGTL